MTDSTDTDSADDTHGIAAVDPVDRPARAEQAQKTLLGEWGDDFDEKMRLAEYGMERHLSKRPEDAPVIERADMGNDVETIRAMSERGAIQARIDEIHAMKREGFHGEERYKSDAVQREIQGLYRKLNGDTPIIGRLGRTA